MRVDVLVIAVKKLLVTTVTEASPTFLQRAEDLEIAERR